MKYKNKLTGAIATWHETFSRYHCIYKKTTQTLFAIQVEGSGDWEEVTEVEQPVKGWRIESFMYDEKKYTIKANKDQRYSCDGIDFSYDFLLNKVKASAHSILLDSGEVFAPGDKITVDGTIENIKHATINKFSIINNKLIILCDSHSFDIAWAIQNHLRHYIEPTKVILTTHDGVEITDPIQTIYWVDKKDNTTYECDAENLNVHPEFRKGIEIFTTPQARTAYINSHTKKYSIADLEAMNLLQGDEKLSSMKIAGLSEKDYIIIRKSDLK